MEHQPRSNEAPAAPEPIASAVRALGAGALDEAALVRHIHPLFRRVLARDEVYLANHSLGRPPDVATEHVARFAELWSSDMDGAWGAWLDEINAFRARVATLIGLSRPDAVVPRPGAGQGLRSVLNALGPPKDGRVHHVLSTRAEFDSIDFILKTYASRGRARVTWVPTKDDLLDQTDILRAIDRSVDLVVVSQVVFATGQHLDRIGEIVRAAHGAGALCLIDMYHAAGVVQVDMEAMGADFAIGGSYKYFRGGPGAGWLAIHPRHLSPEQPTLRTLDTGWFAKRDTFRFQRTEDPLLAPYGDAWMECTPAPLTAYQANPGLALLLGLGVDRLRAYSVGQQTHLAGSLESAGVRVRAVDPHGAFMLVRSPDAAALCGALKGEGVNVDARGSHIRLCPDILNTRAELERAAKIIGGVRARTGL